ncbi:epithelial sodium channel subunit alpha-like [Glandiceps talaboti]
MQEFVESGIYPYSMLACQKDCLQSNMSKVCGCVDTLYSDVPLCDVLNKTQDACVQLMYFFYVSGKLGCDCKQPCRSTSYTKTMSQTSWPSSVYSNRLWSSLVAVNQKIRPIHKKKDLSRNLARLKFYFESLNSERLSEVEDYPLSGLWADIGGALGLWIGLSIITVVEFFEFVFEVCARGRVKRRGRCKDPKQVKQRGPDSTDL